MGVTIGSLRNHDGNENCTAKLLLFQTFRFIRVLVFCSNLLPLRVSEVVLFNFTTLKPYFWQDWNQMFWPSFARGQWPETFKASFSKTNQTANKRRRQRKRVKIFLNFTYLHKTPPGQKTAGNFPNFLKTSTHQMFWYPGLDAGLNSSRFGGDLAFSERQNRRRLAKPSLRHFKSGDKTS